MTYAQLITDIGRWMNRTRGELDAIAAQQIIESQYELEKKAPLWFLVDEYSGTLAYLHDSIKVPNYTIQVMDMEVYDSLGVKYPFSFKTLGEVRDDYPNSQDTGRPEVGAMMGHVIEFGPVADADYTARMRLWHHLDPLNTTTNTSNEWTTIYLAALRYHVLVALSAYIKDDPRISVWEQRLGECLNDIQTEVTRNEIPNLRNATCEMEDIY
jgi:hypothetical protein